MKKLSIILVCALVALFACTKSKEVYPEIGDGNDEILTVGMDNANIKYTRSDIGNLQKVVFHYSITEAQQFDAAEMTKKSDCFEVTVNNLVNDTLYSYYYELFPYSGNASLTTQKTFHTQVSDNPAPPTPPTPPSDVPEGAINGLFTVDSLGHQVYFSQGNLQYQASTNTWRFAENQWNYVGTQHPGELSGGIGGGNVEGSDNYDASEDYNGWIDIFNWGTSGYDHGAIKYHPWDYGGSCTDYLPYGSYYCNLFDNNGQADWGYNAIYNGGNIENQWRTLTTQEWSYVMNNRSTTSGMRYAKAKVNEVNGLIVFPDEWLDSIYDLNNINQSDADYDGNNLSESVWREVMQYNGAVFLPAAGHRQWHNNDIDYVGVEGVYWSSTRFSITSAYNIRLYHSWFVVECYWELWFSCSVRLVQDATR